MTGQQQMMPQQQTMTGKQMAGQQMGQPAAGYGSLCFK
jgi:hypothetical protein